MCHSRTSVPPSRSSMWSAASPTPTSRPDTPVTQLAMQHSQQVGNRPDTSGRSASHATLTTGG